MLGFLALAGIIVLILMVELRLEYAELFA